MSLISNLTDKIKGRAKQTAGGILDDERLQDEGKAQEDKADSREDAERLEEIADEKHQEADGHKGQEKSQAKDR